MLLRYIALLLILTGCCIRIGHAQEAVCVRGGDTLRYRYTPLAADTAAAAAPVKKGNIFHRIVDYFSQSTIDRTFEKKIDFTFAGGPSYSKNTSFGIGVLAAGLYRIDRSDSVTPPSDISIFANVSVSGFYALGVTGNNIFRRNRSRIDYAVSFSSAPRYMWGIGYEAGRDNPEKSYDEKLYRIRGRYLHRVWTHLFVGGLLDFRHVKGLHIKDESYIDHQKHRYTASGLGAIVEYDSRDFIPNPYRGVYVSLQETFYPKFSGNCGESLWRTTVIWRDAVLAADLYGEFNSAGTPWPMLARLGGGQRMRGYYEGRYTDNDLVAVQLELRQRIWRRIGCTVWGGAGNVFADFASWRWSHTLPNYGFGLRWELKKRVNIRLDYGFGRKTGGFLLNINEAF